MAEMLILIKAHLKKLKLSASVKELDSDEISEELKKMNLPSVELDPDEIILDEFANESS